MELLIQYNSNVFDKIEVSRKHKLLVTFFQCFNGVGYTEKVTSTEFITPSKNHEWARIVAEHLLQEAHKEYQRIYAEVNEQTLRGLVTQTRSSEETFYERKRHWISLEISDLTQLE